MLVLQWDEREQTVILQPTFQPPSQASLLKGVGAGEPGVQGGLQDFFLKV